MFKKLDYSRGKGSPNRKRKGCADNVLLTDGMTDVAFTGVFERVCDVLSFLSLSVTVMKSNERRRGWSLLGLHGGVVQMIKI